MPGPGTYHCTVVAYNKALEPSEPVCSDGVTVDTTAPEIHGVSIENSWTKDGLAEDSNGNVWYIDRNRFRIPVERPSHSCRYGFYFISFYFILFKPLGNNATSLISAMKNTSCHAMLCFPRTWGWKIISFSSTIKYVSQEINKMHIL